MLQADHLLAHRSPNGQDSAHEVGAVTPVNFGIITELEQLSVAVIESCGK